MRTWLDAPRCACRWDMIKTQLHVVEVPPSSMMRWRPFCRFYLSSCPTILSPDLTAEISVLRDTNVALLDAEEFSCMRANCLLWRSPAVCSCHFFAGGIKLEHQLRVRGETTGWVDRAVLLHEPRGFCPQKANKFGRCAEKRV